MAQTYYDMCQQATISINQNVASSKAGLSALEAGNINIGDSDLSSSNLSLSDHHIAAVIYVMIVNASVSQVTDLSISQIQGIYSGSITNWQQVGDSNLPIFVVNRTTTSGTRATFEKYILGKKMASFPTNYDEEDTSGLMVHKVATTAGAIGYVDLRDALVTQNLKTLTINGVQATTDQVKNKLYPFWTIEHLYTRGNPSNLTNAFIQYIFRDEFKSLISSLGYVPFSDIPPATVNLHPSPIAPDGL
jgi:phosphate transport system substrate-binding protein